MLRTAARTLLESSNWSQVLVQAHHLLPVAQAVSGQTGAWLRCYAKQAGQSEGDAAGPSGAEATTSSSDEAGAAAGTQDFDAEGARMDVAELQELLQQAQEEAAGYKDRLQRTHAEMQNLIARQNREKETLQTYAVQKFAESLLEVADNLESAARAVPSGVLQEGAEVPAQTALKYLKALLEGVQATERVLLKNMGTKGVQRIDTVAVGADFDPNVMEAMSVMPCPGGDAKPGSIANVWQSGYKIHDRILRAAKVIVYQE